MSKYPATNIVYSGLEDKGGPTVTILDEKKNKWTIWKADYENKDQDSEAYSSLKNFHIGESFGVEYGEKEESFTPTDGPNRGKSINFTRRTIYKILPTVANPTTLPPKPLVQAKESNLGHSLLSSGPLKDDAFWERQAYEKCCSLWIGALIQKQGIYTVDGVLNGLGQLQAGEFHHLFKAIKADGAKRFSGGLKPTNLDLPVIQVDDEVNVDSIPF